MRAGGAIGVQWSNAVLILARSPATHSFMRSIFHLAYNVRDLDEARRFYGQVLGCSEGRSTDTWVDFDFFGHQLSLHLGEPFATARTGHVGDVLVPMPHLGLVLELPDWQAMADRLKAAGTAFVLEPQVRFEGQPGEQWTMFFMDPFGNPIEMKGFRSLDDLYKAA
ncbi:Glyoxalase/bleomycin resistance protein/dioxygenase [Paracidovorax avenae ATCC 19860]|uniref:Glyoxalase/bleomycin resistance protein/dioxygenase n=2 Tax=Paracidovorax avenae TaxID=80867 RepID=F0Q0T0_PARA1|nr:Glyoxalase/bleomycin resistance protein/dioxygenase [Paracidovorax avenae ATCC 19860]